MLQKVVDYYLHITSIDVTRKTSRTKSNADQKYPQQGQPSKVTSPNRLLEPRAPQQKSTSRPILQL